MRSTIGRAHVGLDRRLHLPVAGIDGRGSGLAGRSAGGCAHDGATVDYTFRGPDNWFVGGPCLHSESVTGGTPVKTMVETTMLQLG
ncbi:MAG: hypothetical protein J0H02_14175 [Armatimonadetes bacterium]|nr:hypothetical protein [Armatimonadota bacterium]